MLSEEQELDEYIITKMIELLENYIDSKKISNENKQLEIDFEIRKNYISNLFLLC